MAGEKAFPPATPERPIAPPTERPAPPTDDVPEATAVAGTGQGVADWPWWLQGLSWAVAGAVVAAALTSAVGTEAGGDRPLETRVLYQCANGEVRDSPCPRPAPTAPPPTRAPEPPPTTAAPPPPTTEDGGPATTIPPGIHAVGEDIAPGRYRSAGGDFCYWATLSGRSGNLDEIIANDISDGGAQIVEIDEDVAYFETAGCEVWVLG